MKVVWALAIVIASTIVTATNGYTLGSLSPFRSGRVTGRITNGQNALAGDHPYQVSYQAYDQDVIYHICGGSIISPTYVVTAGHCVTLEAANGRFRVVVGIVDLNDVTPYRQNIEVVKRTTHPKYKGGREPGPHDIALLQLAKAVTLNPFVKLIGLPNLGEQPSGSAVLSGWGSTSTAPSPVMPNRLQTATISILPYEECRVTLNTVLNKNQTGLDKDANFCTGSSTSRISSCSGDSGGPLAQNGTLIGVVSWGVVPCGDEGTPSVFTKVSTYVDFIKSNVPDLPTN